MRLLLLLVLAGIASAAWLDAMGAYERAGDVELTPLGAAVREIEELLPVRHHEVAVRLPKGASEADMRRFAEAGGFKVLGRLVPDDPGFPWFRLRREGSRRGEPHALDAAGFFTAELGARERRRGGAHPHETLPDWHARTAHARNELWDDLTAPYGDAGLPSQWQHHGYSVLPGHTEPQKVSEVHANTHALHKTGVRGSHNTIIHVVDTGSNYAIGDLAPNHRRAWDADLVSCTEASLITSTCGAEAMPSPGATHGTSCACAAAASGANGDLGVGTCPECAFTSVRLLGYGYISLDEAEARALMNRAGECAGGACRMLYSNSWGDSDRGRFVLAPHPAVSDAMARTAAKGWGFFWAAGNGKHNGDSAQFDLFNASPHNVVSVGGVARDGASPWYGETGPVVMVVAPTSGMYNIDYPDGVYTCSNPDGGRPAYSWFTGTSAATPVAAGAFALVWDAHPTLSFRDMTHVLMHSATHVGLKHHHRHAPFRNGAGLTMSYEFGAGRVDAGEMHRVADRWHTPVSAQTRLIVGVELKGPDGEKASGARLPPLSTAEGHVRVTADALSEATTWEGDVLAMRCVEKVYVALHAKIDGGFRGVREVSLTSPSGTTAVVMPANHLVDTERMLLLGSVHTWGEAAEGLWTVRVSTGRGPDVRRPELMRVFSVRLLLTGNANCPSPSSN